MPKTIEHITAKEIQDSRGNPTLEVSVVSENCRAAPRGGDSVRRSS